MLKKLIAARSLSPPDIKIGAGFRGLGKVVAKKGTTRSVRGVPLWYDCFVEVLF